MIFCLRLVFVVFFLLLASVSSVSSQDKVQAAYKPSERHRELEVLAREFGYEGGRRQGRDDTRETETYLSLKGDKVFREHLQAKGYTLEDAIDDRKSGLQAMVVRNSKTGETTIVFRGTEERQDLLADIERSGDVGALQYEAHRKTLDAWAKKYPKALVTGHSLGAALGQRYVADHVNAVREGVFFNPPGIAKAHAHRYASAPIRPPVTLYVGHAEGEIPDIVSELGGQNHLPGRIVEVTKKVIRMERTKTANIIKNTVESLMDVTTSAFEIAGSHSFQMLDEYADVTLKELDYAAYEKRRKKAYDEVRGSTDAWIAVFGEAPSDIANGYVPAGPEEPTDTMVRAGRAATVAGRISTDITANADVPEKDQRAEANDSIAEEGATSTTLKDAYGEDGNPEDVAFLTFLDDLKAKIDTEPVIAPVIANEDTPGDIPNTGVDEGFEASETDVPRPSVTDVGPAGKVEVSITASVRHKPGCGRAQAGPSEAYPGDIASFDFSAVMTGENPVPRLALLSIEALDSNTDGLAVRMNSSEKTFDGRFLSLGKVSLAKAGTFGGPIEMSTHKLPPGRYRLWAKVITKAALDEDPRSAIENAPIADQAMVKVLSAPSTKELVSDDPTDFDALRTSIPRSLNIGQSRFVSFDAPNWFRIPVKVEVATSGGLAYRDLEFMGRSGKFRLQVPLDPAVKDGHVELMVRDANGCQIKVTRDIAIDARPGFEIGINLAKKKIKSGQRVPIRVVLPGDFSLRQWWVEMGSSLDVTWDKVNTGQAVLKGELTGHAPENVQRRSSIRVWLSGVRRSDPQTPILGVASGQVVIDGPQITSTPQVVEDEGNRQFWKDVSEILNETTKALAELKNGKNEMPPPVVVADEKDLATSAPQEFFVPSSPFVRPGQGGATQPGRLPSLGTLPTLLDNSGPLPTIGDANSSKSGKISEACRCYRAGHARFSPGVRGFLKADIEQDGCVPERGMGNLGAWERGFYDAGKSNDFYRLEYKRMTGHEICEGE